MNEERTAIGRSDVLQGMLFSMVGIALGAVLGFSSLWGIGEALTGRLGETAAYAISGAAFGAFFGLGGSLGLAPLLSNSAIRQGRWTLGGVIGGALGMALSIAVILTFFDPESTVQVTAGAVLGLTLGLSIGAGQWIAVRRRGIAANEWPVLSAAAYAAGLMAGLPAGGENREWLALAVMGSITGLALALGLVWQLRRAHVPATGH